MVGRDITDSLFGVLTVGLLAAVGTAMGPRFPGIGSLIFVLAAPVLPLTLAMGPVRRRLLALVDTNDQLSADLAGASRSWRSRAAASRSRPTRSGAVVAHLEHGRR